MNEIFNGIVKRNMQREISFLSNTAAAVVTIACFYGVKSIIYICKYII